MGADNNDRNLFANDSRLPVTATIVFSADKAVQKVLLSRRVTKMELENAKNVLAH